MDSVGEIIQLMDQITDCLYQQKMQEGYDKFNVMVSKLSLIMEQLYQIFQHDEEGLLFCNILMGYLDQALKALEQKDIILLADILHFEIKERLLCLE